MQMELFFLNGLPVYVMQYLFPRHVASYNTSGFRIDPMLTVLLMKTGKVGFGEGRGMGKEVQLQPFAT